MLLLPLLCITETCNMDLTKFLIGLMPILATSLSQILLYCSQYLPCPENFVTHHGECVSDVQVLMAGGSSEYCAAAMSPAGTQSFLVDVTPGANHSVVLEDLAQPRVVLLNHCLL